MYLRPRIIAMMRGKHEPDPGVGPDETARSGSDASNGGGLVEVVMALERIGDAGRFRGGVHQNHRIAIQVLLALFVRRALPLPGLEVVRHRAFGDRKTYLIVVLVRKLRKDERCRGRRRNGGQGGGAAADET